MTAVAIAPDADDETNTDEEIADLRERLIALTRAGARVFCVNRRLANLACLSGYIASVSTDHVVFDVLGRSVPIQLGRIVELRAHSRIADPVVRVVYVEKETAT